MRTKNLWYKLIFFSAFVVIATSLYVLYTNMFAMPLTANETTTVAPSKVETSTSTAPSGLYDDISEADFVTFASSTIEKKCPFYVPDGNSYRECLAGWVEELQQGRATETDINAINSYCETFTAKYQNNQSMAGSELFVKCTIFKLTNLFR